VSERREPLGEGPTEEELAGEQATEVPASQAMPATGDVAIPLDPDMAADALLGQDAPGEPEDSPAG
jgi:hypothetical protein